MAAPLDVPPKTGLLLKSVSVGLWDHSAPSFCPFSGVKDMFGITLKKKYNGLDRWIEEANTEVALTPDYMELEEKAFHLLFVYDELQNGHWMHKLIAGSMPEGEAFTVDTFHVYRKRSHEAYPIPILLHSQFYDVIDTRPGIDEPSFSIPLARIRGKLYLVRTERYLAIDNYKLNGIQYKRERVRCVVPFKRRQRITGSAYVALASSAQIVRAFMYIAIPEFWEKYLDGGLEYPVVKTFDPRPDFVHAYYYFGVTEYDAKID
jgi:Gamma-glutamyl cyclotransferase, AIG2-like